MIMNRSEIELLYKGCHQSAIARWKEFLRFQSISTDPAYHDQCLKCAEWLTQELKNGGFHQSTLLQTPSKPVVYAEFKGKPGSPTVLFYGHYDVQPVDPVDLWSTPPFEPTEKNGRIYARGAEDNKGQVSYAIAAMESLIKANALGCTVRLFLEGEEESGSRGIGAALKDWKDKLKGDLLMVCDTNTVASGAPTITMGLRGIVHLTVRFKGPSYDLHSGLHGGAIRNPATELARLVATFHNSDGTIAVKGFYDQVREPSAQESELARAGGPSFEHYAKQVGAEPIGGEIKYSPAERVGFRPTIEINGFHSGYGGPGSKTIIPSVAEIKISARMVADQDPAKALEQIIDHIKAHTPKGIQVEIDHPVVGGPAVRVSMDSPFIKKARDVLDQITDLKTAFLWEGGAIPIVTALTKASGAEPVLVGFGSEEDRIHAPNESFGLEQFRRGFMWVGMYLSSLSK